MIDYSKIQAIASGRGLELVGAVSIGRLQLELNAAGQSLIRWQQAGYAGEMEYMKRGADLLCRPQQLLPGVKSVISFAVPYASPAAAEPESRRGFGRIARYARGRDYHRVLKKLLGLIAADMADGCSSLTWRAFSDAVPFLERAAGACAGLGFCGKNTMIIRPGYGSYFFLAELLINQELDLSAAAAASAENSSGKPAQRGCGSCRRCQIECPTGAFAAPHILDSRRCISYLTIEKKGGFNAEERQMVGEWLFGCDRCQEVCPLNNRGSQAQVLRQFACEAGAGALIELKSVFEIESDAAFQQRFSGTALMRTGRQGLIRNALAVAANQDCTELIPSIAALIGRESSPLLRIEGSAALSRLSLNAASSEKAAIEAVIGPLHL